MRPKTHVDDTKNKQGECFADFILEYKMIVVSGRVTPEFDDFTSKGPSFVEYICVPQDWISKCINFRFKILMI